MNSNKLEFYEPLVLGMYLEFRHTRKFLWDFLSSFFRASLVVTCFFGVSILGAYLNFGIWRALEVFLFGIGASLISIAARFTFRNSKVIIRGSSVWVRSMGRSSVELPARFELFVEKAKFGLERLEFTSEESVLFSIYLCDDQSKEFQFRLQELGRKIDTR